MLAPTLYHSSFRSCRTAMLPFSYVKSSQGTFGSVLGTGTGSWTGAHIVFPPLLVMLLSSRSINFRTIPILYLTPVKLEGNSSYLTLCGAYIASSTPSSVLSRGLSLHEPCCKCWLLLLLGCCFPLLFSFPLSLLPSLPPSFSYFSSVPITGVQPFLLHSSPFVSSPFFIFCSLVSLRSYSPFVKFPDASISVLLTLGTHGYSVYHDHGVIPRGSVQSIE